MSHSTDRRRFIGAMTLSILFASIVSNGAGASPPTVDPAHASALKRIETLNPHLTDEKEIPNLSLKVHSLSRGPYDFFRGTADLFYVWCRSNCADWLADDGTSVLLHGDVHPGNTGTYVAAPDGGPRLAYSLVDFDESIAGPFELDLLRAVTSLRFAAAENGLTLSDDDWSRVVAALVSSYRAAWIDIDSTETGGRLAAIRAAQRRVTKNPLVKPLLAKARGEDAADYVDKYTKGHPPIRFKKRRGKKKLKDVMLRMECDENRRALAAFESARKGSGSTPSPLASLDGKVIDIVRWVKVGSSGSQGVRKYLVLLEPPKDGDSRPSIFQLKQEPMPAAARAGIARVTMALDRGRNVAEAYSRLQARPRRLVGWTQFDGRSYLIKPKDAFCKEPDTDDLANLDALLNAARLMGGLLGVGHAKSRIDGDVTKLKSAISRDGLAREIASRSAACFAAFRNEYQAFRQDTRARDLSAKAAQWLTAHDQRRLPSTRMAK